MEIVKKIIRDLVLSEKADPLVVDQLKIAHWPAFENAFTQNKLSPQLLPLIINQLAEGQVKLIFQSFHRHYSFEIIKENHILQIQRKRIFTLLNEHAIDAVFLKGQLLAEEGKDRVTRDLDILVHVSQLSKIIKIMANEGYKFVSSEIVRHFTPRERKNVLSTLSWYNEFHFFSKKTGLLVEFHTNLFPRARVNPENLEALWANRPLIFENIQFVEESGLRYKVLSSEIQVIQTSVIINVKRSPSKLAFSLRDLSDLKNLCSRNIDWSRLEKLSEGLQVKYHVFSALALLNRFMKNVVPENLLSQWKSFLKPSELFMYRLHMRCMKDLLDYHPIYPWVYRLLRIFILGGRGRVFEKLYFLRKMIMPSRWFIIDKYGLSKENPFIVFYYFLLPLNNIFILLKRIFGIKEVPKK
ncbi:MAG: nucleotidyltransferase family protein [Spirochaetales bacterium]|nr:nucleotidyltransferase family protein [Spirochaetales bacterium]